ncbi:inner membrane protein yede [Anaeramoeba flamelloides]|uniref:Inner membrane protein yede n=1 Tax=Anaeramoeba flamelloides TaxID=1746091 RepID=A0ABQ8YCI1_9EUKA|nr:inner membrane protein yede [Anaeramoeba flamelloides]
MSQDIENESSSVSSSKPVTETDSRQSKETDWDPKLNEDLSSEKGDSLREKIQSNKTSIYQSQHLLLENKNYEKSIHKLYKKKPIWLQLVIVIFCAFLFGWGIEKGRVFQPDVIMDQFIFKRWLMMKMFLSAITTSFIFKTLLSLSPKTKSLIVLGRNYFFEEDNGLYATLLGGFLLGSGMYLCGACPGTLFTQFGAGINPWATFLGGILASLIFGLFRHKWIKFINAKSWTKKNRSLDAILKKPFWVPASAIIAILVLVIVVLEILVPSKKELEAVVPEATKNSTGFVGFWQAQYWYPELAGLFVGSVEVLYNVFLQDGMGSASSYTTILAVPIGKISKKTVEKFPGLKSLSKGWGAYQQVIYALFAVLFSFTSATASDTWITPVPVNKGIRFLGGFFIIMGSRLGAGCTSGNGIAAFSSLSIRALLFVPMIFVGAIPTGFIFNNLVR